MTEMSEMTKTLFVKMTRALRTRSPPEDADREFGSNQAHKCSENYDQWHSVPIVARVRRSGSCQRRCRRLSSRLLRQLS